MRNILDYKKIYVAGHTGMIGSAIMNTLQKNGVKNIVIRSSSELDLTVQADVEKFFVTEKPDCVFLVAARVGGIYANLTYPAEFIYENSMIQNNIIHNAYKNNVKKLIFVATSSIYPKECKQPIMEEDFLSGRLEETNDAYAIAKISGIKMCQAYRQQYGFDAISVVPSNMYGLNDKYIDKNSHVIPALLKKIHNAKINDLDCVEVWGSGLPLREFLFSQDCVDAMIFLIEHYSDAMPINIGVGSDLSIKDLVLQISDIVGYKGEIKWDTTKPDGIMRKLLDTTKINNLGWTASVTLTVGLKLMYNDFLKYNNEIKV